MKLDHAIKDEYDCRLSTDAGKDFWVTLDGVKKSHQNL